MNFDEKPESKFTKTNFKGKNPRKLNLSCPSLCKGKAWELSSVGFWGERSKSPNVPK